MPFKSGRLAATGAALVAASLAIGMAATGAFARSSQTQHVILISVDGLHQTDLDWYVHSHPASALAGLAATGVDFDNARTPYPSDSFPGMVALATGGDPRTAGIYYDDTWNHALLPAGTTSCTGVQPGVEVTYFEQLDKDPSALDAGQGLAGLPDGIMNLTGNPDTLIDPTQLPVDPNTCKPVYPHQYIHVNTIFEVARQAGLRTAWADKHPAYEILDGPSGTGVQDLFTPEINSVASVAGSDWTGDNALTRQYDGYKVQAVINEINGFDHSGRNQVGTPAIFGMNFQTVSTAEKLPSGGYEAGGGTPSALLQGALSYVSDSIGAMQAALHRRGLDNNTVFVISAKHGQSPDDPSKLFRTDDGLITSALNAAWQTHCGCTANLVAFGVNDDNMLLWLTDMSKTATDFAVNFLQNYTASGNDISGAAATRGSSGLQPNLIFGGQDAANFLHETSPDERTPDIIGIAQVGTVYTGGKKKIAEHGGGNPQDQDVPILIAGGSVSGGRTVSSAVETTQVAPTILELLGLNPRDLIAVQEEGTAVLPLS